MTTDFYIPSPLLAILLLTMSSCEVTEQNRRVPDAEPFFRSAEIFDPIDLHTHGSTITELPNGNLMAAWFEGSGERWADDVTIQNGNWLIVYNDLESGRHSLAVSISDDEGETWGWTRVIEQDLREADAATSHYPAAIQAEDGTLHVVYSHFYNDRDERHRTIKWVQFNEEWVKDN